MTRKVGNRIQCTVYQSDNPGAANNARIAVLGSFARDGSDWRPGSALGRDLTAEEEEAVAQARVAAQEEAGRWCEEFGNMLLVEAADAAESKCCIRALNRVGLALLRGETKELMAQVDTRCKTKA